ncbi:MAG: hypothetical protein J0H79_04535, partial [Alphaproteobacteria bacterium]|nr:hypothetical protein [Alphaproteobacteria bacterium]
MTAAIVSGKRKRGGQPGNTNAWKHGRRSRAALAEQAAFRRHLRQMWAHIRLARAVMAAIDRPPPQSSSPAARGRCSEGTEGASYVHPQSASLSA